MKDRLVVLGRLSIARILLYAYFCGWAWLLWRVGQLLLFGWRGALCSLPLFQFSRSICPQKKGGNTKAKNNPSRFHNTHNSRCCRIGGANDFVAFSRTALLFFFLCSTGFRLSFLPLPALANLRQSLPHLRNDFLGTRTKDPYFFASRAHWPISGAKACSSAVFGSTAFEYACFGSTASFFVLFWAGSTAAASFQILYSFVEPIPKRFRINAGDSFPRAATISRISSEERSLAEGMFCENTSVRRIPNGKNSCLVFALGLYSNSFLGYTNAKNILRKYYANAEK